MNKYKFLKILERKLNEKNYDKVSIVLDKYKNEIELRYKNHEKQKDIIASFGDIDLLCEQIINEDKKTKKSNKFGNFFKTKNKKTIVKTKKNTIISIILFVLFFAITIVCSVVFVASCFCVLDGIKLLSIASSSFLLLVISIIVLDLINKLLINKEVNIVMYIRILVILFILFIMSSVYLVIEIYKIDYKNKVSDKYLATRIVEEVKMSTNITSISFNSNYNTTYSIKYIEDMENEIKIEVKYFDAIYDYDIKKEPGKVYISLNKPLRDVISFYLNNLKENEIYNINELERYSVTIYVNKDDEDRFIMEKSI